MLCTAVHVAMCYQISALLCLGRNLLSKFLFINFHLNHNNLSLLHFLLWISHLFSKILFQFNISKSILILNTHSEYLTAFFLNSKSCTYCLIPLLSILFVLEAYFFTSYSNNYFCYSINHLVSIIFSNNEILH